MSTEVPHYPIQLRFSPVAKEQFGNAKKAIEQEYADANLRKRLNCSLVEPAENDENKPGKCEIYILHVDHALEFDWTWEGARAWCPLHFASGRGTATIGAATIDDSYKWTGTILNVDEHHNRIFVEIKKGATKPCVGKFLVAPFDFLEAIKNAYTHPRFESLQKILAERLAAAETGAADVFVGTNSAQINASELPCQELLYPDTSSPSVAWWNQGWGIIWGPPGTGKTHTIGQLVAEILKTSPEERMLIVSTTNLATDAVALKIGAAIRERNLPHLEEKKVLRLGKGVRLFPFEHEKLVAILDNDTEPLSDLEYCKDELAKCEEEMQKARIQQSINEITQHMEDPVKYHFLHPKTSAVICTAFKATQLVINEDLVKILQNGAAPFTTVIIDEAGLLSRMHTALLSLLAAQRVILVGDSKQLSPISRLSRILPPESAKWIASSSLVHLDEISLGEKPRNVHFLKTQWRMHPEIGAAVSAFMYDGMLKHADEVSRRENTEPFLLYAQAKNLLVDASDDESDEVPPRAVWYVLDEELKKSNIRHNRGPGNKSYLRDGSLEILDKLFEHKNFAAAHGLFVSPFVAQAKKVREYFAKKELKTWKASTVHCQQGQEADIVIFDTVNAGSTGWTHHEWMRMINVGISRAKRLLIVLSSRAEMAQPYLKPLGRVLQAAILTSARDRWEWKNVESLPFITGDSQAGMSLAEVQKIPLNTLGRQIAERQLLSSVFSQEQQWLCQREIDGKPRLVRGVAGSGKTAILAEWLVNLLLKNRQTKSTERRPFWIVFGNKTLQTLIKKHVDAAWEKETGETSPPEGMIFYHHILRLLDNLALEYRVKKIIEDQIEEQEIRDRYDYDGKAAVILAALPAGKITPRCQALFIDEAQDMGPNTLLLLFKLVASAATSPSVPEPSLTEFFADDEEPKEKIVEDKPVYIFYDNAQNVYGRSTPTWSHLGINLKGRRSTVMEESFRSTQAIAELALNVLYRLKPDELGEDHKELIQRELIEKTARNGRAWWSVYFTQNSGPQPTVVEFANRAQEFSALADELIHLLNHEYVAPKHIRILCNSQSAFMKLWEQHVRPRLQRETKGQVDGLYTKDFTAFDDHTLIITSPYSFKGYEAEIVFIPAADLFVKPNGEILAPPLYVAMTRARSMLKMSFTTPHQNHYPKNKLCDILRECYNDFQLR